MKLTRQARVVAGLSLGLMCVLSGCTTPSTPHSPVAIKPVIPERDLLAEVRALAHEANDGLDVQPLRDPLIADLWESASQLERAGDFAKADAALVKALSLGVNDPELLQWRAELALAQGKYEDAVLMANASWEAGPRLGLLCRRSWATIKVTRDVTGFPEAAAAAEAQIARCTIEPPVRM